MSHKYRLQIAQGKTALWGYFHRYFLENLGFIGPSAPNVAHPAGLEPATPWFEAKYSIQLNYGCVLRMLP